MTAPRPARVLRDLKRIRDPRNDVDLLALVEQHYPYTHDWAYEQGSAGEKVSVRTSRADPTGSLVVSTAHVRVQEICREVAKRARVARENLEAAADLLNGATRWMQPRHEPETNFGGMMSPEELASWRAYKAKRDG